MRKRVVISILLICIASGCGKKNSIDDNRKLAYADEIQEVENFSAFEETELPMPTPTERPQATPTEAPTEISHMVDFDFSPRKITDLFAEVGTRTVTQDWEKGVRTEKFQWENMEVLLSGDKQSGNSYRILEATLSGSQKEENAKKLALTMNTDLNEKNIEKFIQGEYETHADYIGLEEVSCIEKEGKIYIKMVKEPQQTDKIPLWEESVKVTDILPGCRFSGELANSKDTFGSMFAGIEFGNVKMEKASLNKMIQLYDKDKKQTDIQYEAVYQSDTGNQYRVYVDPEKKNQIQIEYKGAEPMDSYAIMNISEHLFRAFYNGTIDTAYDLDKDYAIDHLKIVKQGEQQFTLFIS